MPKAKRTTYTVTSWGQKEKIWLTKTTYTNNDTLAVQAWCKEGPYDTITVNLEESNQLAGANRQFIDTNNCPWAPALLIDNGLAHDTGIAGFSGFWAYPLFEFDVDKIPEYK